MPLRSTGCYACRKRKIRCDEGRPGCQRCITHGIPCPGYRGDKNGGIEFKDLTDVTVLRAKGGMKWGKMKEDGVVAKRNGVDGRGKEEKLDWTVSTCGSKGSTGIYAEEDWSFLTPAPSTTSSRALSTAMIPDFATSSTFSFHFPANTPPPLNPLPTTTSTFLTLFPLSSPALERTALYQSFITHYLPRQNLHNIQEGHFSFFQNLAFHRPSLPALQHGFDALSLVQLGSTYHDDNLVQQATRQYALALRALGRSIAKGDFLHDDEVLAAVVVLSSCELYEGIQVGGQGWGNHVEGANRLVAARGPQSLQSDLALLLFANMRHGVMCHALIERKAPFMARKEWRDVAWRIPVKKDQSQLFYEWGIQVPGLLERHDKLDLKSETALEEVDAILEESREIETELRQWFAGWSTIADMAYGGLSELVPITEFPTFLGLCEDDAFDMAFRFPDFLIGYLQTLYWMTMHFLRSDVQSLHKKRHQLLHDWYPETGEEVQEDELLGYILNLCQSIPSFCEPASSSTGAIGIFLPMRTAAIYFTAHGHWRLLRWIGCVRNNVFVKGLRPPAVDEKLVPGRSPPDSVSSGSSPAG